MTEMTNEEIEEALMLTEEQLSLLKEIGWMKDEGSSGYVFKPKEKQVSEAADEIRRDLGFITYSELRLIMYSRYDRIYYNLHAENVTVLEDETDFKEIIKYIRRLNDATLDIVNLTETEK